MGFWRKKRFWAGFALCAGGAFYVAATHVWGEGCPVRTLTGVPCPGCGLSRAGLAALSLDFSGAFAFHPLFWLVPIVFVAAFSKRVAAWLGEKRRGLVLGGAGVLFFGVYLLRLGLGAIP